VRDEDLAPFAVADGLLAKMTEQPAGIVTDTERQYMLDHARENLARVGNMTLEQAGQELHNAALRGDLTEQYTDHLAVVTLQGRISMCWAASPCGAPATRSATSTASVVLSLASLLSRWEMLEVGPCRNCSTS
jgi:hypothetical protein